MIKLYLARAAQFLAMSLKEDLEVAHLQSMGCEQ